MRKVLSGYKGKSLWVGIMPHLSGKLIETYSPPRSYNLSRLMLTVQRIGSIFWDGPLIHLETDVCATIAQPGRSCQVSHFST